MMLFRRDRRPPPPGELISVNGIRWHVETTGEGPQTLVLLHGYLGSTAGWYKARSYLDTRMRVVLVDLPGAGYSDRPLDAPYDLRWFAAQFGDLLKELDLGPAFLGGHSFGGSVVLHHAASGLGPVPGLVLVSPLVYSPPPPPGLRIAKKFPGLMGRFFASPVGKAIIPHLVRKSAFASPDAKQQVRVKRLVDHLDAPGGWEAATAMGLRAAGSAPGPAELGRITAPVFIAWGAHDQVYLLETAHRLREDLGGESQLLVLEDSAHNSHEEQWELFSQEAARWMELQDHSR